MSREVVTMLVEPHEGNEDGEVRIYRDELPPGARVKEDGDSHGAGSQDPSRMNKTQLIELLTGRGVELTGSETKAELLELIEAAQ